MTTCESDHRCQLLERLQSGASGTVWRALDPSRGEVVAVKLLHQPGRAGELPELPPHPHLLAIHRQGPGYLVMELADGGAADAYLDRAYPRAIGSGVEAGRVEAALRIGREVALGLAALHDRGLVHRDVKPSNILLAGDGIGRRPVARLADFDLVTQSGHAGAGVVQGTPTYMAPEQHLGERVDTAADLYALGATVVELVTGCAPFANDARGDLEANKRGGRLSDEAAAALPSDLRALIDGLLAVRSEDRRPRRARDVVSALETKFSAGTADGLVGDRLIGRESVLAAVAEAIGGAGDRPQAVAIYGPRGSGRSAVLAAVRRYAAASGLPLHERLESVPGAAGLWSIDDLDRAPLPTVDAVVAAVRALRVMPTGPRAVIAVTVASDTDQGRASGARLLAAGAARLEIAALAPPEVSRLLRSCTLHDDDPAIAERLSRASGGLPGLLEPLLAGRRPSLDVAGALSRLEPASLRCLRSLAIVGEPVAAAAIGAGAEVVGTLLAAGLAREPEVGWIELGSEVVGEIALEITSTTDRRALARSLRARLEPEAGSLLALRIGVAEGEARAIDTTVRALPSRLERDGGWASCLQILDRAGEVELPERTTARVELLRARCLEALGRADAAQVAAEAAIAAAGVDDDVQVAASMLAARLARAGGDADAAARHGAAALASARRGGLGGLEAMALIELGRPREGLAAARAAGDRGAEGAARIAIGDLLLAAGGTAATAARAYRRAAQVARDGAESGLAARAYGRLGNLSYQLGKPRKARAFWTRSRDSWDEPTATQQIISAHRLGLAAMADERPDDAATSFAASARACRGAGELERLVIALNGLVTAETDRLEVDAARAAGGEALALAERLGDPFGAALIRLNLAHLGLLVGDADEVTTHATAVESHGAELGDPRLVAIAMRDRATLIARSAIGDRRMLARARALYDTAFETLGEGATEGETALRIELDRCLVAAGASAASALERAVAVQARADAAGMRSLERLAETVVARLTRDHGEPATALQVAERAVRRCRRAPLGETTLLAHAARAAAAAAAGSAAELVLKRYRSYAEVFDRVAHRLGERWGKSFAGRPDLGATLVEGVIVALAHDIGLAQQFADRLTRCPQLRWRADARIAGRAAEAGLVGVAVYRADRARETLARHPELEVGAALDPVARSLLVGLN